MKRSFATIFQEKNGKTLWSELETNHSGLTAVESANKLKEEFGISMHPGALNRVVENALSANEINRETFPGFARKRKGRVAKSSPTPSGKKDCAIEENDSMGVKDQESEDSEEKLPVEEKIVEKKESLDLIGVVAVCTECGHKITFGALKNFPNKPYMSFGLGAKKCHNCGQWGTFVCDFTLDGIKMKMAVVPCENGLEMESFVDDNLKPISRPVPQIQEVEVEHEVVA